MSRILAQAVTRILRPESLREFNLLKEAQYWSPDEIRQRKAQQLRSILAYAYQHCPYYRKAYQGKDACWCAETFNWGMFENFPVLGKEDAKGSFDALQSDEVDRLKARFMRSGGSTGLPTRHMQDEWFRKMNMASNLLFKDWGDVALGDKCLHVQADELDYFGDPVPWKKRIIDFVYGKEYFNAFKLTQDAFGQLVGQINRIRPAYIHMYATALLEFAKYIIHDEVPIHSPNMVLCIAGATYDGLLDLVEKAFKCPALARYGSRETGDMAGLCKMRSYHEMPFTHHLEIINSNGRPAGRGELGDILVTVLTNRAMPIIRYKIGDMGMWLEGDCACGVKFPAMKMIGGRTGEMVRNSRGKIITPEIFIHLVGVAMGDVADRIARFQVVQAALDRIVVKMVVEEEHQKDVLKQFNELKSKVREVMEDPVEVVIEFPKDIPNAPSGKYSYTKSFLAKGDFPVK